MDINPKVRQLIDKGVGIPAPSTVEIGPEVDCGRISGKGVVIHSGCRLLGESLFIAAGSRLGREAPVTVDGCQLGPGVELKGGYVKQAVFLAGAAAGSGAHVREGTILEEGASIAHTVGLKQTILFPFVTLGSLINFCDVLMAGGTDRKNHSEVGSAYIHFNYTPNQDKATASLLGDVPRGVLLNQAPIFLGGQGGLVGPCRIEYGTVIAAGTIQRKDQLRKNRLIVGGGLKAVDLPFRTGVFRGDKRIVQNNLIYIANLRALGQWYRHVRAMFVSSEHFPPALWEGLQATLQTAVAERIRRLGQLAEKMNATKTERARQLADRWTALEAFLSEPNPAGEDPGLRDAVCRQIEGAKTASADDYLAAIRSIDAGTAKKVTDWLQGIVADTVKQSLAIIPAFA